MKFTKYEGNPKTFCHLWYANTIKRDDDVEGVEEIVTISKVKTSVECEQKPKQVVLQPANQPLDFEYKDGGVFFEIKDFNCYEIVGISR